MKQFIPFSIFLSGLSLTGCSSADLNESDFVKPTLSTTEITQLHLIRTPQSAARIAQALRDADHSDASATRSQTGLKVFPVGSNTTRSSNDTVLYVVEYGNHDGFSLIAANKTVEPVLAYVEKGDYSGLGSLQNPSYQYALAKIIQYASNYETPDTDATASLGLPLIPTPSPEYTDTIYPAPKSKPLVTVEWGQRWPEGIYCPNGMCGCGPLSVGQILSAMELPKTISYSFPEADIKEETLNWKELKKHKRSLSSVSDYRIQSHIDECELSEANHYTIGRIMREIGHRGQAQYIGSYNNPVGTITYDVDMVNILKSITQKNVMFTGNNGNSLFNALVRHRDRLAFVVGNDEDSGGHGWVTDGTWEIGLIINYWSLGVSPDPTIEPPMVCTSKGSMSHYLHHNWGWNGECNGWFLSDVFNTKDAFEYDNDVNWTYYDFSQNIHYYVFSTK